MATTIGKASFQDLVTHGFLRVGDVLAIRRRSAHDLTAQVDAAGSIRYGGHLFESPSAAAKFALRARTADGWLRWRVPDQEWRTLAEVRATYDQARLWEGRQDIELALGQTGELPFRTLLADPPWRFQNRTGKVAPEHKRLSRYDTLSWKEIATLPVRDIMSEPAHCYLWVPNALIDEGLRVLEGWGFTYKSMLVWHKVRKDGGSDGRGVGFYFRNVTELVLFGVRGKLRTLQPGRRQVNYLATRKREHSRKPDELYDVIEACSPGPYIELFARYDRAGWTSWGNEADLGITPRGRQYIGYGASLS